MANAPVEGPLNRLTGRLGTTALWGLSYDTRARHTKAWILEMTLAKLTIPPGFVSDTTDYAAGPVWVDGDKVRFQQGLPEPIGGWIKEVNWTFTGEPSKTVAWVDLSGNTCLVAGTEQKTELIFNDQKYDISPLRATAALSGPFDTVDTDETVTVNDSNHGAVAGDWINVSGAAAGGGITIDGDYQIATLIDADAYTIEHSSAATSTASGTGGASVSIKYLIQTGSVIATKGLGWGAGTWGDPREGSPATVSDTFTGITQADPGVVTATNTFTDGQLIKIVDTEGMVELNGNFYTLTSTSGSAFTLSGTNTTGFGAWSANGTARLQLGWGQAGNIATSGVEIEPALWSMDLWGEDLVATRRGGGTYTWDASVGTGTRAALVSNAPATALLCMVSLPDRHLILFGAHDGANEDPLLVRWSDQEDMTEWTASATNTAGSQRLDRGTKIISALQIRDQTLIWTDDSVFGMSFQGPPFTFGFRHLSSGCGPLGQNAVEEYQGMALWAGTKKFHYFDGMVKVLPSPVRDHMFDNMSADGAALTVAGKNRGFEEVWFFYASGTEVSPDKYVAVNFEEKHWIFGSIARTTWLDEESWLTSPVATDSSGNLYYHENGYSDDGADITAFCESGVFESGAFTQPRTGVMRGSGEEMIQINKFIPDGTFGNATINLRLYTRKYPNGTETTKGPYALTASTTKKSVRAKGKQVRIAYQSIGAEYWQMGIPRINYKLDGNPGA